MLEAERILSVTDATFDDKFDSDVRARLSGYMTIVVPDLTAAEHFLAPFVAGGRRDDDDDDDKVFLILLLVFAMVDEDGSESGELSEIRRER
jgi:hypothetical protein